MNWNTGRINNAETASKLIQVAVSNLRWFDDRQGIANAPAHSVEFQERMIRDEIRRLASVLEGADVLIVPVTPDLAESLEALEGIEDRGSSYASILEQSIADAVIEARQASRVETGVAV